LKVMPVLAEKLKKIAIEGDYEHISVKFPELPGDLVLHPDSIVIHYRNPASGKAIREAVRETFGDIIREDRGLRANSAFDISRADKEETSILKSQSHSQLVSAAIAIMMIRGRKNIETAYTGEDGYIAFADSIRERLQEFSLQDYPELLSAAGIGLNEEIFNSWAYPKEEPPEVTPPAPIVDMITEDEEFAESAIKIWELFNYQTRYDPRTRTAVVDAIEGLKKQGYIVIEGDESSLKSAAAILWSKIPENKKTDVKEIVRLLAENVAQHGQFEGRGVGILVAKVDRKNQRVDIAVMDKGSGFPADESGKPIIEITKESGVKQVGEEEFTGIAFRSILSSSDKLAIYTKGHAKGL